MLQSCRPVLTILIMTTKWLPFEITWYDGCFLRLSVALSFAYNVSDIDLYPS